jgi:hypothetical protein
VILPSLACDMNSFSTATASLLSIGLDEKCGGDRLRAHQPIVQESHDIRDLSQIDQSRTTIFLLNRHHHSRTLLLFGIPSSRGKPRIYGALRDRTGLRERR